MKVKSLIFDLGGVIIDILPARTVEAFSNLSGLAPDEIYRAYTAEPIFFAYERGELSDRDFRAAVKGIFRFESTDDAFDQAWNAMLIDLPESKLNLLARLKNNYAVTFLSNTNNIHITHVNTVMLPKVSTRKLLDEFVHVSYYSHQMGKRKPDPIAFQHVLEENNFQLHETLFLDDNPENILSAARLGIQTFLVKNPNEVFDFFEAL